MSESVVSAPQIVYHQAVFSHPNYKFNQVLPNTYGQTISLGTSQNSVQMTIPAEVFNLAQSYLSFQVVLPGVAGNYI